jgi:hypothetical protein
MLAQALAATSPGPGSAREGEGEAGDGEGDYEIVMDEEVEEANEEEDIRVEEDRNDPAVVRSTDPLLIFTGLFSFVSLASTYHQICFDSIWRMTK